VPGVSLLLGLRLAVAGGREAWVRFALTAVGVGVGATLLLLALTSQAAVMGRAERVGWQDAAYAAAGERPPAAQSADGAYFLAVSDYYDGEEMTRAYVAALGADPPVPPGLGRLPGPGEVAASPALRRLLASTPDEQLDDRFPGRVAMTIGAAGLAHDNELVAVIGRTPDQLRDVRSAREVRSFDTAAGDIYFAYALRVILLVGAVFVLVPVAVHIVLVTRVAAAQRERRLAAIRLAGATRRQTAVLAAAETGVGAVAGALLGWAGYEAGRRLLAATVMFQGGHFWLGDLTAGPWLPAILAGVPVLAVLTTIASLHRVQVSPLGINRRGHRPPPSAWLAAPLVAGIAGQLALAPLREAAGEATVAGLAQVFALLQVVGLVLVGPWLCLLVGRGLARLSRRAPGLLAARRIADDPRATFRAVAGVVLAAFAVAFIGSGVPMFETRTELDGGVRARPGVVVVHTGGVPADELRPLLSDRTVVTTAGGAGLSAPCAQLSRVLDLSCPYPTGPDARWVEPGPGAPSRQVLQVYVPTDGTLAAENRVRTQVANLVPNAIINSNRDLVEAEGFLPADLRRLGQVGFLFTLLVGACSLCAGMVGGLLERRRPFALLRAAGMRLADLRRVVLLETAAAMAATSALGAALGVLAAYAVSRFGGRPWQWPGAEVLGYLAGGVLAALVFSSLVLPLLDAVTRHDAVRYE
jgi:hypothetical protein